MSVTISRGTTDPGLDRFVQALQAYQDAHPDADIALYRHGQYLVRVRVVDPSFAGLSNGDRHRAVWPFLADIPEDDLAELYTLTLIAPDERPRSIASIDFDDPVPVRL